MKKIGTSRTIDELGRVVVPKEMRERCGLEPGDRIEFHTEGDRIMLCKFQGSCVFCGGTNNVRTALGRQICEDCLLEIKKAE